MQKQLIILFLFTTFSFSISIEEAMMLKYGSYISSSLLFIVLLIGFLLYWTFHYKKSAKNLTVELTQKEDELSALSNIMQERALDRVQNEHKLEKQIFELKQDSKSLNDKLKEGLKSQVVSKIEEYQAKRIKQLDRVDIKA